LLSDYLHANGQKLTHTQSNLYEGSGIPFFFYFLNKKNPKPDLPPPSTQVFSFLLLFVQEGRERRCRRREDWNKKNNQNRSPFKASWAEKRENKTQFVGKSQTQLSKLPFVNINDPFRNRDQIKQVCAGYMIVYIWTYIPTGICLVGSAHSSYARIKDYFSPVKLLTATRLGMQFLNWYGFKDIHLTFIQFDPNLFTLIDVRTVEQFYIDNLYSVLNIMRSVSRAIRPNITRIAYLLSPLRDNPIPIYVYDATGSNLLHLFISKTILYSDFYISPQTLRVHLNTGVLYLDLFLLSTELLKTASQENMLTLEQLLKMKNDHKSSSFLSSYNKNKSRPIHLIHTVKPKLSKKCRSLTDASLYTIYQRNRWQIR